MLNRRTIEEAKAVKLPDIPAEHFGQRDALAQLVLRGNESGINKLRKLYRLVDAVAGLVAPYMVCGGVGCSRCCRVDVAMTAVEAQYIGRNIGVTPDEGRNRTTGHAKERRPCPFLREEGKCSIYEFRPHACRTFFSVDDPMYCEDPSIPHVGYTAESNEIFKAVTEMIVFLNGGGAVRDIRDFFPSCPPHGG